MKKTVVLLGVIALAVISCEKSHTCNCRITQNTGWTNQTVNSPVKTPKMSKKEARQYCKDLSVEQQTSGIQQSTECELD